MALDCAEQERRKILLMALTNTRNALIAHSIFKELKRRYERMKIITAKDSLYSR